MYALSICTLIIVKSSLELEQASELMVSWPPLLAHCPGSLLFLRRHEKECGGYKMPTPNLE